MMNEEAGYNLQKFTSQFICELIEKFIDLVSDCSEDDLHKTTDSDSNHIGFLTWHVMRSIDNVMFFAFDREKPDWLNNEYDKSMSLPKVHQGTDYSLEEAQDLKIIKKELLINYCNDLKDAINKKISNVSDEYLFTINKVVPWGDITRLESIGKMMIAHGNEHLGEAQNIYSIIKKH